MTGTTDPRVDEYIASLPLWQQDICHPRALVHAADPEIVETIKRTKLSVLRGAVLVGWTGLLSLAGLGLILRRDVS